MQGCSHALLAMPFQIARSCAFFFYSVFFHRCYPHPWKYDRLSWATKMQKFWSLSLDSTACHPTKKLIAAYLLASLQVNCCHGSHMFTLFSAEETSGIFEAKYKCIIERKSPPLISIRLGLVFSIANEKKQQAKFMSKRRKIKANTETRDVGSSCSKQEKNER